MLGAETPKSTKVYAEIFYSALRTGVRRSADRASDRREDSWMPLMRCQCTVGITVQAQHFYRSRQSIVEVEAKKCTGTLYDTSIAQPQQFNCDYSYP